MEKDIRDYYLPETVLQEQDYHDTNVALMRKTATRYADNHAVYYPLNSKEYHVDALFKQLIDRCVQNGYYDVHNVTIPLINPNLRKSFIDFVKQHTY